MLTVSAGSQDLQVQGKKGESVPPPGPTHLLPTRPASPQTVALKESHEAELSQTHASLKQLRAEKEAVDDELAALKAAHQVGYVQA